MRDDRGPRLKELDALIAAGKDENPPLEKVKPQQRVRVPLVDAEKIRARLARYRKSYHPPPKGTDAREARRSTYLAGKEVRDDHS